jgi:hypothetical protein
MFCALGFATDETTRLEMTIEGLCLNCHYAWCDNIETQFDVNVDIVKHLINLVISIIKPLVWSKESLKMNMWHIEDVYRYKHHQTFMKELGKKFFNYCLNCKTLNVPFRCSHCHVARYCSEECSRTYWKTHKIHCGLGTIFYNTIFLDT